MTVLYNKTVQLTSTAPDSVLLSTDSCSQSILFGAFPGACQHSLCLYVVAHAKEFDLQTAGSSGGVCAAARSLLH